MDLDSGSLVPEPKLFIFQYSAGDRWSPRVSGENLTQTVGKSLIGLTAKLKTEEDKETATEVKAQGMFQVPWSDDGVTSGMEKRLCLPSQTATNSPVGDIRHT